MRVLKTYWFHRFAKKQNILDSDLLDAVERAEKGQIDADLGGGLIKQRVARQGEGKRSGYRTFILHRSAERAFFVYGFAKNEQENITKAETVAFKELRIMLDVPDRKLDSMIEEGKFWEVAKDDGTV